MDIVVKRTNELTKAEVSAIYRLFEVVFEKKREDDSFFEEFGNTSKGYSYHAIGVENGEIVGHNVYVPFRYLKDGQPFFLALSMDAMVHPAYRGKGLYRKLLMACGEAAMADGCKMRMGFPNDNSYPIQVKYFKFDEIGSLDTYCLPIRVGGVSKRVSFLNPLSKFFASFIILFSHLSQRSRKEYSFRFRKDRSDFDEHRYKWFGGDYQIVERNGFKFVYRNSDFKGIQATFLMDVYPLSKRNFDEACRCIYSLEKQTPIILYVGKLPFKPLSMLRIPHCVEPKHFHFVGKVFDENFLGTEVLDIKNWEVNLSNYDLL